MRRVQAFGPVLAVVLGVVAPVATAAPAAAAEKEDLIDRIVGKADETLLEVLITTKSKAGVPRFDTIQVANLAAAKRVVGDMLGRRGVVAVEMNQRRHTAVNDPLYRYQWALNASHLDINGLYRTTLRDTRRPVVAVVDTGVQANHPDLVGRVAFGYNVLSPGSAPSDGCGHGTHVAGVIAAKTNNRGGIAGLSRTATILPIKVLDSSCSGFVDDVAEGIIQAVRRGAHVINLSVAGDRPQPSPAEEQAVAYARSRNRIVIAAAGNHTRDTCGLLSFGCVPNQRTYPAAYPSVIGVAALGPRWTRASFSNYGSWVDVSAPGVSIMSTMPRSSTTGCGYPYCRQSGTSMAAPHVSAVAAMALAHCSNWWSRATTRDNIIIDRLQRRASHFPTKDSVTGYGYVRPKSVLTCI